MRTFIAIELDAAIKRSLAELIRRLSQAGPGSASWVREAGMHLTLKFLGEVEESRIAEVGRVMDDSARAGRPFPLEVKGTGYFPNARFPRILWVGVAPSAELDSLAARLEDGLAAIGFEREERAFHPHLTLGRVRAPSKVRNVLTELDLQKNAGFGAMTVTKITLYQSVLGPSGAVHTALKESALP